MEIGVPKENKDQEFRVGLSPSSVRVHLRRDTSR
jgi:alanine dehydrogenase